MVIRNPTHNISEVCLYCWINNRNKICWEIKRCDFSGEVTEDITTFTLPPLVNWFSGGSQPPVRMLKEPPGKSTWQGTEASCWQQAHLGSGVNEMPWNWILQLQASLQMSPQSQMTPWPWVRLLWLSTSQISDSIEAVWDNKCLLL